MVDVHSAQARVLVRKRCGSQAVDQITFQWLRTWSADGVVLTQISLQLFYNLVWGPQRLTRRSMRGCRTLDGDRWIQIPIKI